MFLAALSEEIPSQELKFDVKIDARSIMGGKK